MIFLLTIVAIITFFIVKLWIARQKLPKGPTPLPLLGNFFQVGYYSWKAGSLRAGFSEFQKQYGKVFTLWMGPVPTVHIVDFDVAVETHIKRANIFAHRFSDGGMNYIREGRGIFASNGYFWMEHRRFALTTLRNFGLGRNIMEEKIMKEYNYRFNDFQKTHFNNGAIEVNANTCIDYVVGSIINQLLLSKRFEYGDSEFEHLKDNLSKSFESLSPLEGFAPLWVLKSDWMKWRTKYSLAPFDYVFEVMEKFIRDRVLAIEQGEHAITEEGDDFVDAYLIKIEKDKSEGIESSFDLETLAVDLYDLWQAGLETTATTLAWAFAYLLNYPKVVTKIREELVQVTGGTRSLSLTDRKNTAYLNATVNEIQRTASILNLNVPRLLEEDTFIDGQPVSAGAVVTVQMPLFHTDEHMFENPTEFKPERFLENSNLEKKLIPFGIGKRTCPGESLARAEIYLITGNIVLDFDLKPVGDVPEIKSPKPFSILNRPPVFDIRFVPVQN